MPDGLVLALNAAEARLQLVLARVAEPAGAKEAADGFLAAQEWHAPSQGVELLAPALEQMLARLHCRPEQIRRIACVRGPGSFTGLRLVLATAAGLSRATAALQAGIEYLPLLVQQAYDQWAITAPANHGALWVLTHARRNLVHLQGFAVDRSTGTVSPLGPVAALPLMPEENLSESSAVPHIRNLSRDLPLLFLGSGRTRNLAVIRQLFPDALHLPESFDQPSTTALLRAARAASYTQADLAPLYIRASDAEENLPRIAVKLGLDPHEAGQRLRDLTSEFSPQH